MISGRTDSNRHEPKMMIWLPKSTRASAVTKSWTNDASYLSRQRVVSVPPDRVDAGDGLDRWSGSCMIVSRVRPDRPRLLRGGCQSAG
jgi:hypothetical protein